MRAYVISDVHLGSQHFLDALLEQFLNELPDGVALILNGDILDFVHHDLPESHQRLLERLRDASFSRRVIWVYGNHDDEYQMEDAGRIEFCRDFRIGKQLYINHGYDFDNVMSRYRWFVRSFRCMHRFRMWLGAEPVHVAQYAKRWSLLYRYLRRSVLIAATDYAREQGFEAVTCGHTHFAEDVVAGGVRYINTGSWTELPVHYIDVTDAGLDLKNWDALAGTSTAGEE